MGVADLEAVRAIDRASFPTPAKAGLYRHEVEDNPLAHYQVLLREGEEGETAVIGYAGFWMMADEAHVSTIAVLPAARRRGLGELLLLNLLHLAGREAATLATLEVRRRNTAAQALYRKYRFQIVGERPNYYRDTGEDALLMTAYLNDAYYAAVLAPARARLWRRLSSTNEG
jgi:ribosomal-protein-alanine N-acetyltransferase